MKVTFNPSQRGRERRALIKLIKADGKCFDGSGALWGALENAKSDSVMVKRPWLVGNTRIYLRVFAEECGEANFPGARSIGHLAGQTNSVFESFRSNGPEARS